MGCQGCQVIDGLLEGKRGGGGGGVVLICVVLTRFRSGCCAYQHCHEARGVVHSHHALDVNCYYVEDLCVSPQENKQCCREGNSGIFIACSGDWVHTIEPEHSNCYIRYSYQGI